MKRDPSIHVTESELALALTLTIDRDNIHKINNKELAKQLTSLLKTKTLINRSIIVSNDKLEKKTKKLLSSSRGDADLLANIIYNSRKKRKHRGIKPIKPNSRDWGSLKELTALVIDFCNEFELNKREGFIRYIEIGFSKLSSPNNLITKLLNMYEGISQFHNAKIELDKDESPTVTKAIHDMYCIQVISKTGLPMDYEDQPEKYLYFYKLKNEAKKLGVTYETFIKAQFHAFEWKNGIPDVAQLVTDKSKERLNKYLFEFNIKVGKSKIGSEDKIEKLKNMAKKYHEDGKHNNIN